jgi:hypothetical protein
LIVFCTGLDQDFAILQARPHEIWNRRFGATLGDAVTYNPSDVFLTFATPDAYGGRAPLGNAAIAYLQFRASIMISCNQGITETYNRFHDRRETGEDIKQLRELHSGMDRAVLHAYGWHDLAERAEPQFLDETNEDDQKYQGRLFWPAEFRDEVLARLLDGSSTVSDRWRLTTH